MPKRRFFGCLLHQCNLRHEFTLPGRKIEENWEAKKKQKPVTEKKPWLPVHLFKCLFEIDEDYLLEKRGQHGFAMKLTYQLPS